tara:strand:+ start:1098 stop:1424 length:327 start_codon:yes stop_codon:yes gene_type:complete
MIPSGYMGHSTNTQVVLSEANYQVVATVTGEASSNVILGFGPSNKKLYARAKSDLYETLHNRIDLKGKSYALTNITEDTTINYFIAWIVPIYFKKTVIMTADVIVFNK